MDFTSNTKIETITITTRNNKIVRGEFPFLSMEEERELKRICFTGRDMNGKHSNIEKYLNSLGKGKFTIKKFKNNVIEERMKFNITRIN